MYSGKEKNMVICVVNNTQIAKLSSIVNSYPNTFAVMSGVNQVMGNFKNVNTKGKFHKEFLDHADGKAV
jgi:uncharacterized membrane-anchored protein YitT (DUF2179 family)